MSSNLRLCHFVIHVFSLFILPPSPLVSSSTSIRSGRRVEGMRLLKYLDELLLVLQINNVLILCQNPTIAAIVVEEMIIITLTVLL